MRKDGSDVSKTADDPDAKASAKLVVTDEGDALTPEGYCPRLTSTIMGLLARRFDPHDRAKTLRTIRAFVNTEVVPGEPWDAFLHEPDRDGEKRILTFIIARGHRVDEMPLDGTFEIKGEGLGYLKAQLVTIRQFMKAVCRASLHRPDSPADVRGWRVWPIPDRIAWARARNYHPKYGMEHAGHRFFARDTASSTRMLYDPHTALQSMCDALDAVDAPRLVLDIRDIHRINGTRPSDFLGANALGWARAGLGDHAWCRNKKDGDELVKKFAIPHAARSRIIGRFEALPHPHDPVRTLMDRVREQAKLIARKDDVGEQARQELATYRLLGRNGVEDAYDYDGYRYWLRAAAFEAGVVVQTDQGPWVPTSIVFRKAAIGAAVRDLHARTRDKQERKEGIRRISDKFHQKTDQTKAYANWEYSLEAIRTRLEKAAREGLETATERASSPAVVRTGALGLAEAQRAFDRLQTRPVR